MSQFKVTQLILIPFLVVGMAACAKRNKLDKKGRDKQTQDAGLNKVDGSLVYAPHCVNPITMSPAATESAVSLDNLLKESNSGTYTLVNTEIFAETEAPEGSAKIQIHAMGSEFKTPQELKSSVTENQKLTVVCHTTKNEAGKNFSIQENVEMPNSFNAADGKGLVMRQDQISAQSGRLETKSTLYHRIIKLKESLGEELTDDTKALIVKDTEGQVTIRLQYSRTDSKTGKKVQITQSGTYVLSQEKGAEEPTKPVDTPEEKKKQPTVEAPAESQPQPEKTDKAS